jgi:FkbM family methyltransferase
MSGLRERVVALPGAMALRRAAGSLPGQLLGLPPIDFDNITADLVRSCVGKSDPTILDVGCNDGQTTRWFLDMFENPTIYCFEPDPRAIARFKQKVGDRPNVTLIELAISDREGSLDFYQSGGKLDDPYLAKAMPEGWDLSGSIKRPYRHLSKHPLVTFEHKIQVPTETLDSVCARSAIGAVDLIWLDVQGAEIEVLSGARATLAQTRYLYTEYSNKQLYRGQRGLRQIVKHLQHFSVVARYPGDALLRNQRLASTDC